jgi:DNA-binding transcriptional ArsR family regulator
MASLRGDLIFESMQANQPSLAEVAALVGNPARANILTALLNGRALTASELAQAGGVAPQTASGHLAKLTDGRLLALAKQGRHSYYRLASPLIASMLESIMAVATDGPARYQPRWRGGDALRNARTCYDHLAGRLGVALADALVERGHIALSEDGGVVTPRGDEFFYRFGIDLRERSRSRRPFLKPCLDWSERRTHLAGALGAALAARSFELGWIGRIRDTRAILVTPRGRQGFLEIFGIEFAPCALRPAGGCGSLGFSR